MQWVPLFDGARKHLWVLPGRRNFSLQFAPRVLSVNRSPSLMVGSAFGARSGAFRLDELDEAKGNVAIPMGAGAQRHMPREFPGWHSRAKMTPHFFQPRAGHPNGGPHATRRQGRGSGRPRTGCNRAGRSSTQSGDETPKRTLNRTFWGVPINSRSARWRVRGPAASPGAARPPALRGGPRSAAGRAPPRASGVGPARKRACR